MSPSKYSVFVVSTSLTNFSIIVKLVVPEYTITTCLSVGPPVIISDVLEVPSWKYVGYVIILSYSIGSDS